MATGYDYASSPHPSPAAIKAAGGSFVCRYISASASNDKSGKNLLKPELTSLLANGLAVVMVYELAAERMLSGKSAGVADAQDADAVVKALGMSGMPIYFACDFDATEANQTPINAYLDGVASVIGKARTGIYGGYYPVMRAMSEGHASYGWQTYAWSGGQWYAKAQLRQVKNDVKVGGADCDQNTSVATDFGQYPRPVKPTPPTATTVPNVVGKSAGNAHNALVAAKLVPTAASGQKASEICNATTPAAGTKVNTGTKVTIVAATQPTIKQGDKGSNVGLAQKDLRKWDSNTVVNSNFDAATTEVTKRFQKSRKLTQDGVIGPATWAALGAL